MVSPVTKEITLSDQPRRLEKLQDGGQPRSKQHKVKFFDCSNWRTTPAEKRANDPNRFSHLSLDRSKSKIRAAPLRSAGLVPQCHKSGAVNYLRIHHGGPTYIRKCGFGGDFGVWGVNGVFVES
jgi:hypothetical protein